MPAAASISDASSPKIHEKKEPLIDRWIQIRSLSLTRPPTLHSYRPAFDAASRPSVSDMPPKGLLALAYCQLISTFLAVRNPSSLAGAALNTGVELRLDKMVCSVSVISRICQYRIATSISETQQNTNEKGTMPSASLPAFSSVRCGAGANYLPLYLRKVSTHLKAPTLRSTSVAYRRSRELAWETDEEFVCHLTQTAEFCWCDIDARSIGLHPAQRLEERQGAKERWWIEAQVSSLGLRAVMREQIRAALPAQHVRQLLSKPSPARRVRKNHATMPILSAAAMASSSSAVLTEKSFMRLQQKITKCSDDETIFAWAFKTSVWIWSYRLQKPSMNRPRS
ncbi:hypothetical protein LTS12_023229 [Elasticomyces elasticus]|nr:hypothetical protein LTS12_023229 [Elasticomyces elasticus]